MRVDASWENPRSLPWAAARALWLITLILHASCASHLPVERKTEGAGPLQKPSETREYESRRVPAEFEPRVIVHAKLLEARGDTRVVALTKADFQRAVRQIIEARSFKGTPQEAALGFLQTAYEEELLAEVYRGRVLSLQPLNDQGSLVPEAELELKRNYLKWCEQRGGGDCLSLLTDGAYLRTSDRRTLALALAFGSVFDETSTALGRELSPQAVVSSLLWTVGLYLTLWLLPEPSTKALAASLSVVLLAWLGVDALWGLIDGWASMAQRAHEATTFMQLREAGEDFGRRIGTDAARAMILAVATLSGRTLGEAAASMRSLPRFDLAQSQWAAQGFKSSLTVAVQEVAAVELAPGASGALSVLTSPQAPIALAMLSQSASASAAGTTGHSGTIDIQHIAGNRQVVLTNGQRWHLPRGKDIHDIPAEDRLGDELQTAAERIARMWGEAELSSKERAAIKRPVTLETRAAPGTWRG